MTTPTTAVSRADLARWLDDYLQIKRYPDPSNNGLQIEGKPEVRRVAVAVDAALQTIEEAAESGADLLIVHHGLFWGDPLMLSGPYGRRVKAAMEAGLNLYAAHIPLDAHPEVGNNAVLAQALSLQHPEPFGEFAGHKIGLKGELPFPLSVQDFADRVQKLTGEICLVHGGGPGEVRRLGVVSGSGSGEIAAAAREGLDTLLTGEPKHQHFHDAFEYGVNTIYAGHYETETFGVRALATKIEETFGLPWQFIHVPTGL